MRQRHKNCTICGNELTEKQTAAFAQVCGVECRKKKAAIAAQKYRKPKLKKECSVCKSGFETSFARRLTCSDKCKEELRRINQGYQGLAKPDDSDHEDVRMRNKFLLRAA